MKKTLGTLEQKYNFFLYNYIKKNVIYQIVKKNKN